MTKCKLTYPCLVIHKIVSIHQSKAKSGIGETSFISNIYSAPPMSRTLEVFFMVMNGIYFVIASACILILAYRFYGAFIAAKSINIG